MKISNSVVPCGKLSQLDAKLLNKLKKGKGTYALLKVLEYRMEGKDKSVPEIQMPKMQMRISQRGGLVRNG